MNELKWLQEEAQSFKRHVLSSHASNIKLVHFQYADQNAVSHFISFTLYTSTSSQCVEVRTSVETIFCHFISIGLTDGIIRTYDLFTAYNPGFFQLEILACDFVGHSTTTNVNIYILRDDQRVKIVFNEIPDLVRENQDDFVNLLSNITGAIVNLDDIQVRLFCQGVCDFSFFVYVV